MEGERRRSLLYAAVGFARLRAPAPRDRGLVVLGRWLGSWSGIGRVAAGMARQGYDLSLTRYDALGWRATFYLSGREHSPTAATGSAFEPTPFAAVLVAAWITLGRPE
jgi:hypothetical protein